MTFKVIPTLKQKMEIFDEYCKERVVEMRSEKKIKARVNNILARRITFLLISCYR